MLAFQFPFYENWENPLILHVFRFSWGQRFAKLKAENCGTRRCSPEFQSFPLLKAKKNELWIRDPGSRVPSSESSTSGELWTRARNAEFQNCPPQICWSRTPGRVPQVQKRRTMEFGVPGPSSKFLTFWIFGIRASGGQLRDRLRTAQGQFRDSWGTA